MWPEVSGPPGHVGIPPPLWLSSSEAPSPGPLATAPEAPDVQPEAFAWSWLASVWSGARPLPRTPVRGVALGSLTVPSGFLPRPRSPPASVFQSVDITALFLCRPLSFRPPGDQARGGLTDRHGPCSWARAPSPRAPGVATLTPRRAGGSTRSWPLALGREWARASWPSPRFWPAECLGAVKPVTEGRTSQNIPKSG